MEKKMKKVKRRTNRSFFPSPDEQTQVDGCGSRNMEVREKGLWIR